VLAFEGVKLGNRLLKLVLQFVLLLPSDLLVFNQLVTGGLPLHLLVTQVRIQSLLFLHQADDCPVVKLHDMVSDLS